jgi:hypothetical protein
MNLFQHYEWKNNLQSSLYVQPNMIDFYEVDHQKFVLNFFKKCENTVINP